MNRRHTAYKWVFPDNVQWSWTLVVVLQQKIDILQLKQSHCFTLRARWGVGIHSCRTSLSSPFPRVCLHSQCPGTLHIGSRSIPLTAATSSHMPNYRICSLYEAKSIPSAYGLLCPHELWAITGVEFSLEGFRQQSSFVSRACDLHKCTAQHKRVDNMMIFLLGTAPRVNRAKSSLLWPKSH